MQSTTRKTKTMSECLSDKHNDKLYDVKRAIRNLYNDVDITHRNIVLGEIKRELEWIEHSNDVSFFACEGWKPQSIGTIKLENAVYAIDPCYMPDTWCSGKIENIKTGVWKCFRKVGYTDWGYRIAELIIRHEDYPDGEIETLMEGVDVGVDSGQAGFFDVNYYNGFHNEELDDDWYERVADLTLLDNSCGTIDMKGVVTSAGFGDGGYPLYVHEEDGKVVGMRIEFISQEELDKYHEEWLNPKPVNGGGA